MQGDEVVRISQVALPDGGGGLLGAVAAKDVSEHSDRLALARPVRAAGRGLGCLFVRDVRFFSEDAVADPPPQFAPNIVQGKSYDLADPAVAGTSRTSCS